MQVSYYLLLSKLFQANVKYLICGGMATAAHGSRRHTDDLDLLIDLNKKNLVAFAGVVYELGFKERIPIRITDMHEQKYRDELLRTKNMLALQLFHSGENLSVDLMIHNEITFEEIWQRKTVRNYKDFDVYFLSLDDLIIMKEKAGREVDRMDLAFLKKVKKESDDSSSVQEPPAIYSFDLQKYERWLKDADHFLSAIRTPEEKIRNEKVKKGEF